MSIKFKTEDGKVSLVARDEVQAAAFKNAGLVFATKVDEAKFNGKEEVEDKE